jgi:hypothetical protein
MLQLHSEKGLRFEAVLNTMTVWEGRFQSGESSDLVLVHAGGGVAVCWIVNLVDRQVEVYFRPIKGGYRTLQTWAADGGRRLRPIDADVLLA